GSLIAAQISHGGMQANSTAVSQPVAPSAIDAPFLSRPARELTVVEIEGLVRAYADAAWRAQEAGFDAVQLHGAHGYLISQFLSPFSNRRTDEWGGDLEGRIRFLRTVCAAVRDQVGPNYPVFIKLGMQDAVEGGLSLGEGAKVAATLKGMGLVAIEISGGIGGATSLNTPTGMRAPADEAVFRPWARAARSASLLPIALVGGLRSIQVMEDLLETGDADFISLCRPLICEPDLPKRLRDGIQDRSRCISGSRCWPDSCGEGIACRCPVDRS
ncbi:MAG: NADH:flavin oxidoreductase, partial [Anaerolineae bacterium]